METSKEYDAEFDLFYLSFRQNPVYSTFEVGSRIAVDVNREGKTVGVELLDASKIISDLFHKAVSREQVKQAFRSIRESDAVYLDFKLGSAQASLAVPRAYKSPVLEA